MTNQTTMTLDPAALSAFAASLTNLSKEEISKAKKLYILNAIADFEAQRTSGKAMMITMGLMCIIPVFLIVFIPGLIGEAPSPPAGRRSSTPSTCGRTISAATTPRCEHVSLTEGAGPALHDSASRRLGVPSFDFLEVPDE